MDSTWLQQFLPLLRCPASKQPLRFATPAEIAAAGFKQGASALVSADGCRFYPIEDGIPVMLASEPATSAAQ